MAASIVRPSVAMTFSRRSVPALVLTLGLVLAACGEESPSPTPDTAPTGAPTTPPGTDATASASPSPDGTPTADAGTPEGWQRITVAEQGFSLAVPPDWEELSPDVIGDSGVMEQMMEANPDAAAALEQAQAAIAGGQIALFAFDTGDEGIESGFATNLNAINVGPVEGTAEEAADEVAEAIRQQIPITGEVETETASLAAGEAAVVHYEWEVDDGAGTVTTVTVAQYAIIGDSGTGFILSMSTGSATAARYEEIFRQIAESFREVSA